MNKPAPVALLLMAALLSMGQTPDPNPRGGKTLSSPADVYRLESLVLSSSFLAADRLAARVLADPAADALSRAVGGLAVLKTGRIKEAEAIFKSALALDPESPEAHLGLGRIARIRNDAETAIRHLRRAIASTAFYAEALRQLWKAAWEQGRIADLYEIRDAVVERYARESRLLPSWLENHLGQIEGLKAERLFNKRLFEMEGRFESLRIPLVSNADPRISIRMISLRLNGKGEYPFDIDSASADFLTVSPLLAEELGLPLTGSSTASGVGTAEAAVRFSILDKVELGTIAFRNVPVMVSDLHPFKGLKKGLLGTALLKRFNVTIDTVAGVMDLYPLERPELLAAGLDRSSVAADVPLYLFDATTIEACLDGAPPALYILDSAAATNLVDRPFFEEHIKPRIDPSRIVRSGIQGAQGPQYVNRVDGLSIEIGGLVFREQRVHEFLMEELNIIGGRYLAGLLGNPLLWPYRVHMDFRNGRLILEKRAAAQAGAAPLSGASAGR